jgi:hypothetical protein
MLKTYLGTPEGGFFSPSVAMRDGMILSSSFKVTNRVANGVTDGPGILTGMVALATNLDRTFFNTTSNQAKEISKCSVFFYSVDYSWLDMVRSHLHLTHPSIPWTTRGWIW